MIVFEKFCLLSIRAILGMSNMKKLGISLRTILKVSLILSILILPELKSSEQIRFKSVSKDMKTLFKNERFSDVSFEIDGRIIPSHKASWFYTSLFLNKIVLRCRCSPLAAMLTSLFQESKQKVIKIPPEENISYDIFENRTHSIFINSTSSFGVYLYRKLQHKWR